MLPAIALLLGFAISSGANAATPLDFPAVEEPFNTVNGYSFPSMSQALGVSDSFYNGAHLGLESALGGMEEHPERVRLGILGFDLLSTWLPLGSSWLHEEWHRAILTNHRIHSWNGVYGFTFSSSISVSDLTDADLARLKLESPADFVRLQEAGIEAQYEQNLALEKQAFFDDNRAWNAAVIWFNTVNSIAYLYTSSTGEANRLTDQFNTEDGSTISVRDFTGLDFTGWVYDLFRPDEPYAARGTHPSGVGIDRYRKPLDLTPEEESFLRLQGWLSMLNLADPFLLSRNSFSAGGQARWNANLRHDLTSFGYVIDANVFYRRDPWKWLAIAHAYVNHERAFPGIEAQLVSFPAAGAKWTGRAMAWLQPLDQLFYARSPAPGGLLGARGAWPLSCALDAYLELSTKTAGWVAGNPDLTPSSTVLSGFIWTLD